MNNKEINWIKMQDYNPNVDYYTPYIGIYGLNIIVFNVSPIDMFGNAFISIKIINVSHGEIKIIIDRSKKLETRDSDYVVKFTDMIANRLTTAAEDNLESIKYEIDVM